MNSTTPVAQSLSQSLCTLAAETIRDGRRMSGVEWAASGRRCRALGRTMGDVIHMRRASGSSRLACRREAGAVNTLTVKRAQPVTKLKPGRLGLSAVKVTHGCLCDTAQSRDLDLRQSGLGQLGDDQLPVHATASKHRDADIVTNGLPIVNIGKLIGVNKSRERTPFGQRLFNSREAANLTQKQVAARLSMSQSTLAGLEKEAQGSSRTVELARLYGVSPSWLATGEGRPDADDLVEDEHTDTLAPIEQDLLMAFRKLPDDDQAELIKTIAAQAERYGSLIRRELAKHGITVPLDPVLRDSSASAEGLRNTDSGLMDLDETPAKTRRAR